jgi:hypothetical protein
MRAKQQGSPEWRSSVRAQQSRTLARIIRGLVATHLFTDAYTLMRAAILRSRLVHGDLEPTHRLAGLGLHEKSPSRPHTTERGPRASEVCVLAVFCRFRLSLRVIFEVSARFFLENLRFMGFFRAL